MHPTMSVDKDGDTVWRVHNGYHCTDGPAIIWQSGRKDWRVNDKAHRTDGPAIEYADGSVRWFLDNVELSFDQWLEQTTGLTDEEKVMYKLRYG